VRFRETQQPDTPTSLEKRLRKRLFVHEDDQDGPSEPDFDPNVMAPLPPPIHPSLSPPPDPFLLIFLVFIYYY